MRIPVEHQLRNLLVTAGTQSDNRGIARFGSYQRIRAAIHLAAKNMKS